MDAKARVLANRSINEVALLARRRTPMLLPKVIVMGFAGVLAMAVTVSYSAYRIYTSVMNFRLAQRAQMEATGKQLMHGVERQLEISVSSTSALSALVQLEQGAKLLEPLNAEVAALVNQSIILGNMATVTQAASEEKQAAIQRIVAQASSFRFNSVAAALIHSYKGITNLQLAPSGVVTAIYPSAGQESAVGHDLVNDPTRREGAMLAIKGGGVVFVGPLTLIQNKKRAIIARNPTFISTPGFVGNVPEFPSFWGFTTMLSELDDLFRATPLDHAGDFGVDYVLYAVTPTGPSLLRVSRDMHGLSDAPEQIGELLALARDRDAVAVEIDVPEINLRWVMELWPHGGWTSYEDSFWLKVALCLLFGLGSLVSLYFAMVRESVLSQVNRVLQRVDAAQSSERKAWSAVVVGSPGEGQEFAPAFDRLDPC